MVLRRRLILMWSGFTRVEVSYCELSICLLEVYCLLGHAELFIRINLIPKGTTRLPVSTRAVKT